MSEGNAKRHTKCDAIALLDEQGVFDVPSPFLKLGHRAVDPVILVNKRSHSLFAVLLRGLKNTCFRQHKP